MYQALAYVAAVALAATFAVAAAAKLTDRPATARGFRALGLPSPYLFAVVVPLIEASLAILLLIAPGIGAGAAVVLLAVFSALIAGRLAQGVHAPCTCFGGSGGTLSWGHLARNGGLVVVGLIALLGWRGGPPGPLAMAAGLVVAGAAASLKAWTWHRPRARGVDPRAGR